MKKEILKRSIESLQSCMDSVIGGKIMNPSKLKYNRPEVPESGYLVPRRQPLRKITHVQSVLIMSLKYLGLKLLKFTCAA